MNHIKNIINENLLTKTGTLNSAILRRDWFKQSDLYKAINLQMLFTNNIGEKIYCILNDITEQPLCPTCGAVSKFRMFKYGYNKTCNKNYCIRKNNTWKSSSKTKILNDKISKTMLIQNYNNNNYTVLDKNDVLVFINSRIEDTNNGKFGRFVNSMKNKNMLCSIVYYTKIICPFDNINFKWNERFYILHHNIVEHVNCIVCNSKSPFINFIRGYQKTCSFECSNGGYAQKCRINSHYEDIIPVIEAQNISILSKPTGGLNSGYFKLKCNTCNKEFDYKMNNGRWNSIYCNSCGSSNLQKDITKFITTNITTNIIENDRKILGGKELDIYLPDKKLAIEVDGVYWHSELQGKTRNYHLDKTKLCESKGIQLIHIFENEWNITPEIVKSIIYNKTNTIGNKIYARKCTIKEIDINTKKEFLNNNHLQGNDNSTYRFGLFYNDELVSVMTFGKRKITKNTPEYELIRFASKLNTNVIGGASKLLTAFERKYKISKLITYMDRRYSNNTSFYQTLGFTFKHASKPNYWYFKNAYKLLSRVGFQKHKLEKRLEDFDKSLSEWENMKNNGYNRIWDCGNYVFYKIF